VNRIVDASVSVATLIDTGPDDVSAEALIADQMLCLARLAHIEATKVRQRLQRNRRLTSAEADLGQLGIELLTFEPFSSRISELPPTNTRYDAWQRRWSRSAGA